MQRASRENNTIHFSFAYWQNMLKITVIIKGQRANKAYPAVNVLLMLSTKALAFPCTLQDESIDPLSVAPAGVGLRV